MGKKTSVQLMLECMRSRVGTDANVEECVMALSSAVRINKDTARKILTGTHVRPLIAKRVADQFAIWGVVIPPGDLAMGSLG